MKKAINSKVQLTKRSARGYRNIECLLAIFTS
ncbi:transposase [Methyloprofundus sedimenti]